MLVNDMKLMIISRRDEGMAVACQGLTGDLVIFSSMFRGGGERQHFAVWKALYEEIKGRERQTQGGVE